ncbi:MAG: NAD(P)H-binding protein [Bacteroidales bacterium]|nr:NAD(P)H-binding protein [Bacteroidales bacterium]
MKIIIYGATGMVGQSVLNECLKSPIIKEVLIIGRKSIGISNTKIKEIIHSNFLDYSSIVSELKGYDACFYCLGVSSTKMSKEKYFEITYDYTVAAAEVLSKQNPDMRFTFVSGAGTDETGKSRQNWAVVKGKAENILSNYPFKTVSLFRPAYIKAVDGIKSTYVFYIYFGWLLYPIVKTFFPKYAITTRELGKAMINTIFQNETVRTYESSDIKKLAYINL